MKSKGSRCDFIEERDADLLRAYKDIIAVRDNISYSDVIAKLAKSPSKRFWVSPYRAYDVVCRLLRGDPLDKMIPTRREMFQEIFRRFNIYHTQNPSLTKMDVVWKVCYQEAPSFYLTPLSIRNILSRVRKEAKRKCLEQTKKRLRFMLGTL